MLTDWPAPTDEAELLEQVHRRARVITTRRVATRGLPVVFSVLAVTASLLMSDHGRPMPLRVAGQGTATDEPTQSEDEPSSDSEYPSPDSDGAVITVGPVAGSTVELPPKTDLLPSPEAAPPSKGPHAVNDPEDDEEPDNDGIDLRYGDVGYEAQNDMIRFTIGVTNLAVAPQDVQYNVLFVIENRWSNVTVMRDSGRSPYVLGWGCSSDTCPVVFDTTENTVVAGLPLALVNKAYPGFGKGSTLSRLGLTATADWVAGPVGGSAPTGPHDAVESDASWTLH